MGLFRGAAVAALLMASPQAAQAAPLDALIAFDDAYRCAPGKALGAILAGIIGFDELAQPTASNEVYKGRLTEPPIPARFRDQVGKPTLAIDGAAYRATLPLSGTWKGLPLHALVVLNRAEGEGAFHLVFDASRDEVLKAANQAGFQIPKSGWRRWDGEALGVSIGVETLEGKGALYCAEG